MYRVAIIQNGVEMQHSGYVDALPMYKRFGCIGKERAEFTRFSGVNIRDLFSLGEKYLLDFDALILGTNATSDDDVYNVLREDASKSLLSTFIDSGKGVLICSQKKYQPKQESTAKPEYRLTLDAKNDDFMRIMDDTGKGEIFYSIDEVTTKSTSKKRVSAFLPQHYEYIIDERPSDESSKDGSAVLVSEDRCTLNQKCVMCLPHLLSNDLIIKHCEKNTFQRHYYRDTIIPVYDSAYQPIIIDDRDSSTRNLLMIAVPQKKERIVISTMALDWAGHEELLENVLNYLTRGIPHTAFVHKNSYENKEMKILTLDAEMSKVGYVEYYCLDDYLDNVQWHSLVVFSPDYEESEVLTAWKTIKERNKFTKAYHYRDVGDGELVLVKYSNNTYIEQQKVDVLSWLNSRRGRRLWDNSLWKTYDVAKLLYNIGADGCPAIINQIVEAIIERDDKNKPHYKKDGSYDGVLAPSCGVMEILYWAKECSKDTPDVYEKYDMYYQKTRAYLIGKYNDPDNTAHNKMFMLRSFYKCNDVDVPNLVKSFPYENAMSFADVIDLDLCLYAEISIIFYKFADSNKSSHKKEIINAINELLNRQMKNGKWDNLSNTATILTFFLQNMKVLKEVILKDATDRELIEQLNAQVDRGITAIKTAYSTTAFNWENNIVTTASSLLVLYLYDNSSAYKSKDFLKSFINESYESANYNALNLALNTLDKAIDDLNRCEDEIFTLSIKNDVLESKNAKEQRRLYLVSSVAGFSLFGLLSMFAWLALEDLEALRNIVSEVFMWIPVVIGMAIPPIVMFIIKKTSTISTQDEKKKKRSKNTKKGAKTK